MALNIAGETGLHPMGTMAPRFLHPSPDEDMVLYAGPDSRI
jgi:hypothetical protein